MSRIIANNIRHNDATADSLSFDSSARVGIGTSSPQASLHIGNGTGNGVEIGNNGTLQVIDRGNSRIEPLTVTAENVAFSIARNTSTTLHDERARITYDGLTFNGDTAAANALDDYEEGTWDPVYNFSTSGDATVVSAGRYIKVGSIVHVQGYVYINSSNSLSGNVLIAGLPFASSSSPSQRTSAFVIGQARAWPENHPYLRLLLEPNSTAIKMFNNNTSATSNTRLTNANFTAAAEKNIISFSGAYTV